MLMKKYPNDFGFSVSHTTRSPRAGEQTGVDYHFTDVESMEKMIANHEFIEYARVHKNIYGTSTKAVHDVMKSSRICILDIDVQGVNTVMDAESSKPVLRPMYVFIAPPSVDQLESRLRARATDSDEAIRGRVNTAKKEIEAAAHMPWDKYLMNDDLNKAYNELEEFIRANRAACSACRESKRSQ